MKTDLIDREAAKILPRSFERRQKSDYGDFFTVTLEEGSALLEEVDHFVEECSKALEQLIAAEKAAR